MKIQNPNVTLDDVARNGAQEEVRSGFLDWLFQFSVTGDDGELYSVGESILSMARSNIFVIDQYTADSIDTGQLLLSHMIVIPTSFPPIMEQKRLNCSYFHAIFYRERQIRRFRREKLVFATCSYTMTSKEF